MMMKKGASEIRDDLLVKFSPDGEVLKEISLLEVLFQNNLYHLLASTGEANPLRGGAFETEDPTHINDVEELSLDDAASIPGTQPGDLMVSARNLDLVIIFDPESLAVHWYQSGPWLRQHDPEIMRDGRISIFNNNHIGRSRAWELSGSSIDAIDPQTRRVETLFPLREEDAFYSDCCGMHQHLDNGNILITIQEEGRLIEVSKEGEIVWE